MESNASVTLREAANLYLGSIKNGDAQTQAQQVHRFVQWYGGDRAVGRIRPPEVGDYGEQALGSGSAPEVEHLQEVKKFLSFARKKGLVDQGLAQHVRIRKAKKRSQSGENAEGLRRIELTREGHTRLSEELKGLQAERGPIAAEIKRAAADKDVRENAPLEAAREHLGQVESRIRDVEYTLRRAVIAESSGKRGQPIKLGSKVVVKDQGTKRQTTYTIVGAAEASPLEGKISDVSPVGKALMGRSAGQEVEVVTPRGKLAYAVVRVTS